MVEITLDNLVPATIPDEGWKVRYRIKGSGGAYTVPVGSPFMSFPITFQTTDPAGTLYEGFIKCDCGTLESTDLAWETPCDCTDGSYAVNETGTGCKKTESIAATVSNSGFCLTSSVNAVYSQYGSRIYNPGFTNGDLFYAPGTVDSSIYGQSTTTPQWCNPALSTSVGPMNREGVWIDSNCDGNKDALTITSGPLVVGVVYEIISYSEGDSFTNVGASSNANGVKFVATGTTPTTWTNGTVLGIQKTTIAYSFNNVGGVRTIFVGLGGDNQFKLEVNGVSIADTDTLGGDLQFKLFHIIPVVIQPGVNYFNVIALGDGSTDDSIAMVIYDNTAAQLLAATDDSQLNILFKSSTLRGTTYDVATCPPNYSLDTSGGAGNYSCKRILTKVCNSIS